MQSFFFVNGEKKRKKQLTKLCFKGKGSQVEHDKVNAKLTEITNFYEEKARLVQTFTCIVTKFQLVYTSASYSPTFANLVNIKIHYPRLPMTCVCHFFELYGSM